MNAHDSERIKGLLEELGLGEAPNQDEADVLVFNTCTIREKPDTRLAAHLGNARMLKEQDPGRVIAVGGCYAEAQRDRIFETYPFVDVAFGPGSIPHLAEWLGAGGEGVARGAFGTAEERAFAGRLPMHRERRFQAWVQISMGCNSVCAYCIVPAVRGREVSRRPGEILAEVERLAAQGVREITLIGQDTTCYGEDLGLRDGVALLLERLAQIENLRWVRFLYAYPNKITGKLLETIAAHEKICSYIDVPLQHASASVLKRMKRGAGAQIFLKSMEKMRRAIPDLTLRTSFIVGFPGETEQDFEELCQFVKAVQFDWLGVFSYSDEEGSAAWHLENKVPPCEIERRRKKLMQIQRQISKKSKTRLVGKHFDVLALGPSEETELLWEGRAEMHAPEIDGKLFINDFGDHDELVPGTFYRCEITEAHDYDLVARII